jgi:hypothetical protein
MKTNRILLALLAAAIGFGLTASRPVEADYCYYDMQPPRIWYYEDASMTFISSSCELRNDCSYLCWGEPTPYSGNSPNVIECSPNCGNGGPLF